MTKIVWKSVWQRIKIQRIKVNADTAPCYITSIANINSITHGFKSPHELMGYAKCGVTLPVNIKIAISNLSSARDALNYYTEY